MPINPNRSPALSRPSKHAKRSSSPNRVTLLSETMQTTHTSRPRVTFFPSPPLLLDFAKGRNTDVPALSRQESESPRRRRRERERKREREREREREERADHRSRARVEDPFFSLSRAREGPAISRPSLSCYLAIRLVHIH